ncbi:short-chain dehydrogenase, partial [Pseudomonas aeruginosa]
MQNILISGAASGIGAARARLFHPRGWGGGLVALADRALGGLSPPKPGPGAPA